MKHTPEQVLVMQALLLLVGILYANSASGEEFSSSIHSQAQGLDEKSKTALHKCLSDSCFYRSSVAEFLACAQENCIGALVPQKRWIDPGYYSQRRRSTGDEVERCIRMNCKDLKQAELGRCAVNCGTASITRDSSKYLEAKRDWLDPTQFRERKSSEDDTDAYEDDTQMRALLAEGMVQTELDNMVRDFPEAEVESNGLDVSLKPRWLDPMVYNSKTGKPKNTGKRNYFLKCPTCFGNVQPGMAAQKGTENTGLEGTFSVNDSLTCIFKCRAFQSKVSLQDCLRKCVPYHGQNSV